MRSKNAVNFYRPDENGAGMLLFPCFSFVSPLAVVTKNIVVTRRFIKETQWFINTEVYKGVHSVLVTSEAGGFDYSFGLQRWLRGIAERD